MKRGQCAHYNGHMTHDKCNANIGYLSASGLTSRYDVKSLERTVQEIVKGKLPCYARLGTDSDAPSCPKYREPTNAEITEYDAQQVIDKAEQDRKMALVMPIVNEWRTPPGGRFGKTGEFDCPICKRGVVVVIEGAHTGGALLMKCETPGCFTHMEQPHDLTR